MEFPSVLAWPLAVVVSVMLLALIFRQPFSKLIDRITGFKYGDAKVEASGEARRVAIEQQKEGAPQQSATPTVPAGHAMPPAADHLAAFESETRDAIVRFDLPRDVERAWLIRWTALARFQHAHEVTFRLLLGSQIEFLKSGLKSSPPTIDDARAMFNNAKAANPEMYESFSFEAWLNFPINRGLAQMYGVHIATTPIGREFLKYLLDAGLTYSKVG